MNGTKTRNLMLGMFGIAAVGLFSTTQGCSSSSSGGTGGKSGGNDGATGTGGATTVDGAVVCSKLTAPLIADFTAGDAGTALVPGNTVFAFQQSPLTPATFDSSTGALKVTINTGGPTGTYPYAGFGLPFPACEDVSSYTGVKFDISGTLNAGCTIQFSLNDEAHTTAGTGFGTCTAAGGCYAGADLFTLPATTTNVMIPFASITAGAPASPILSPEVATGVQWQLNVPGADGGGGCNGDVTVDNVTLY